MDRNPAATVAPVQKVRTGPFCPADYNVKVLLPTLVKSIETFVSTAEIKIFVSYTE